MGMSAEEYWHGTPELTKAYAEAYKIRKEERNWELWLQGLYFKHALDIALSNAFDKNSKAKYMDKPLDLHLSEPTEEEQEAEEQKKAEDLARRLTAWEKRFNGH